MAQKFLTDIELTRGLKDSSGDLGSSGQVLSSTGTGLNWITNAATASVVYQDGFTGDGTTTAFTLANSIDNENKTQVYLDGVYQHKDTYSLSGTTLTFSTAPPNSSDIEVISFASVTADGDILTDSEFSSAGLMKTNGSGTYSIVTDNSSNWNTAYTYSQVGHLPLAGGTLTGNVIFNDDVKANFGTGNDLRIYHDGTNSYLDNTTGHLYITNYADDKDIKFISDNGSGGTEVYFELQGVSGGANPFTVFPDNSFLVFGNGHDLRIYHDTSHSYIEDTGTGDLRLKGDYVKIIAANNETMLSATQNGAVELYYDNSKKFETTSAGATVTGDLIVSANLTVNGTTTTLNTQTVEVEDNILQLNTTQGSPDTATATTSGISVYRGNGVTQASFIFDDGDDTWDLTNNLVVAGTISSGAITSSASVTAAGNSNSFGTTTFTGDISIPVSNSLYFGGGSHTYIREDIDDRLRFFTGGAEFMRFTEDTSDTINFYADATFAGTIASGAITVTGGSNQTVIDADIAFDLTDGSKDTLLITNNKTTSAVGAIGPSIGFGNMNSDRRTSAIGAIRTGADHDNMGLAFFTHPSDTGNETIVKQLELAHDGTATFAGNVDVNGSEITVGNTGSIFAENNLRFKSSGAAYIDHNTTGQSIVFRTSTSSSLDTTALTLTNAGNATFAGLLFLPDGSAAAPSIGNTGDTNTGMYWPGNHQLGFAVDGSRKFYMSTTKAFFQNLSSGVEINAGGIDVTGNSTFTGNVGINTTSPTNLLDIKGNGNSKGLDIHHSNGNMVAQLIHGGSGDEGQLKLYDSNSETVRISGENNIASFINSGNVGIGTTNPGAKLDIGGDLRVGNVGSTSSTTNYETVLRVKGKNNYSDGTTWYGDYGQIILHADTNMTGSARRYMITSALNNNKFAIVRSVDGNTDPLVNSTSGGDAVNSGTADFVIDNSGRIGIGTTAPSQKLHVKGDSAILYTEATGSNQNSSIWFRSNVGGTVADRFEIGTNIGNGADLEIYSRQDSATRFLIESGTGNVGIGTTGPGYKLHVYGDFHAAGAAYLTATNSSYTNDGLYNSNARPSVVNTPGGQKILFGYKDNGAGGYFPRIGFRQDYNSVNSPNTTSAKTSIGLESDGRMSFKVGASNAVEALNIKPAGYVGIGTTSPAYKLHISEATDRSLSSSQAQMRIEGNGYGAFFALNTDSFQIGQNSNSRDLTFHSGASSASILERMRIKSHGDVVIGGTSTQNARTVSFDVGTNNIVFDNCTTSGAGNGAEFQTFRRNNGTNSVQIGSIVMNGTSGVTYATSSDYRLKENVVELTNALDRVDQLKPSRFNFISDESRTIDGFLAHEVQDIVPEAIVGTKDEVDEDGNPKYQSIDQSKLVPLLVGAIKELKAEIEQLKTQINGTN